jgi:2'-5' RNA ligase
MRLFTAIDLSEEIRARVDNLIGKLQPLAPIAWSRAANLHITTKFIGEWPEDRLPDLRNALAGLASREPISIRAHGLGFFPHRRSPHSFWAGVDAPPALSELAHDTNRALEKLGIDLEAHAFNPHLTLARIRTPMKLPAFHDEVARLGDPEFGSFTADRFFLYLSKPGAARSVYTKLSEFPISKQQ